MYAQATAVAVPLKSDLTYPSGIRGVLESMALAKATICTRTPVLEELFEDGKELVFVDAGNSDELRQKVIWLCENEGARQMLQQNAQEAIKEGFDMTHFVESFENELKSIAMR